MENGKLFRTTLSKWEEFIITRPGMGPSLGFVTDVFFIFCVELCYILWSVLLHHWSCIAPLFLDTIWVSSDGNSNVKTEMWQSCFRKTLCGLKRNNLNKGCWLNAWQTTRMRLVGEVGWSIGECRFIFIMPVAGWRRIEFIPSATSC